jgi:hypothetical protein
MPHTPGPWDITPFGNPPFFDVNGEGDEDHVGVITRESDARLIAAAPDLLQSCKALLEWIETGRATKPALTDARKAIRKATEGR